MFLVVCVCQSVCPQVESPYVPITHGAFDLTVQGSLHQLKHLSGIEGPKPGTIPLNAFFLLLDHLVELQF